MLFSDRFPDAHVLVALLIMDQRSGKGTVKTLKTDANMVNFYVQEIGIQAVAVFISSSVAIFVSAKRKKR